MEMPEGGEGMIIPISKLRVGQRFSWIPAEWQSLVKMGPSKLLSKVRVINYEWDMDKRRPTSTVTYDIKFDAAVVNPPGVVYGINADTKVRLLKPLRKKGART
jgi:hypothetical protein